MPFPQLTSPDRDYVWEGDELMFEDIVASTQPLNYNPAYLRKFDYSSAFHNDVDFEGLADDSIIEEQQEMFIEDEDEYPPVGQVQNALCSSQTACAKGPRDGHGNGH